jgi:hypothetical protein
VNGFAKIERVELPTCAKPAKAQETQCLCLFLWILEGGKVGLNGEQKRFQHAHVRVVFQVYNTQIRNRKRSRIAQT